LAFQPGESPQRLLTIIFAELRLDDRFHFRSGSGMGARILLRLASYPHRPDFRLHHRPRDLFTIVIGFENPLLYYLVQPASR